MAEKGSFNSNLVKFDAAMKQTIEMASAAYKNEGGLSQLLKDVAVIILGMLIIFLLSLGLGCFFN